MLFDSDFNPIDESKAHAILKMFEPYSESFAKHLNILAGVPLQLLLLWFRCLRGLAQLAALERNEPVLDRFKSILHQLPVSEGVKQQFQSKAEPHLSDFVEILRGWDTGQTVDRFRNLLTLAVQLTVIACETRLQPHQRQLALSRPVGHTVRWGKWEATSASALVIEAGRDAANYLTLPLGSGDLPDWHWRNLKTWLPALVNESFEAEIFSLRAQLEQEWALLEQIAPAAGAGDHEAATEKDGDKEPAADVPAGTPAEKPPAPERHNAEGGPVERLGRSQVGGMTVEQANQKAQVVAHKLRKAFFALSERQQAEMIGCHWKTWAKTPSYSTLKEKGLVSTEKKPSPPKTESLTSGREAVIGEGDRDEVLKNLIAELEADKEPSPLENDPPDRQRKVHFRKRM
jgi:hypothetical protein